MFPLRTGSLPPDVETLKKALEQSLQHLVQPAGPMVAIEDKNYPALAAIRVRLDQATALETIPPLPSPAIEQPDPALQVEFFEVSGHPVYIRQAAIDFSCKARAAAFYQGRDASGNLLLSLQKAAEGKVELSLSLTDLEKLVRAAAKAAAARQGIILEDVRLIARAETERSVALEVHLRARKLFLSTQLRIKGRVEIDEQFNARLDRVECMGEGTLGTLACGVLDPHLQRFNDRQFSLQALPLGEIKLRQVRLAIDDHLRLRAEFGSEAAAEA